MERVGVSLREPRNPSPIPVGQKGQSDCFLCNTPLICFFVKMEWRGVVGFLFVVLCVYVCWGAVLCVVCEFGV